MAAEEPSSDLSFREKTVQSKLADHEKRITTNERWRLLLKGAVFGLAMASGSDRVIDLAITLI
jgi:hypothetical protein